jgi:predicted nucleic acid-binding protein
MFRKFLACALEAKANHIVSGGKHLLALKHFHGIQIVDAKAFVEIVSAKKGKK